jgi:hypothetical protein
VRYLINTYEFIEYVHVTATVETIFSYLQMLEYSVRKTSITVQLYTASVLLYFPSNPYHGCNHLPILTSREDPKFLSFTVAFIPELRR